MSPKEFKEEMIVIREVADGHPERFHIEADDLICKVMRDLGYGDGIDIFEEHERWYS